MKQNNISAEKWLTHAKTDFDLSNLINDNSDVFSEQICFHAQQSVEKALKAVLTVKNHYCPLKI